MPHYMRKRKTPKFKTTAEFLSHFFGGGDKEMVSAMKTHVLFTNATFEIEGAKKVQCQRPKVKML